MFAACFATCPVVVGPAGVVGVDEGLELPPHAASSTARGRVIEKINRLRTGRAYRFAAGGTRRGDPASGGSVPGVRRPVLALIASACAAIGLVCVAAEPAFAHICPGPGEIPVGQLHTIAVAVTVEGTPVPDVEIALPSGLRLGRVDPKSGWHIERAGATLRYRGGPIVPYTCQFFSLGVTAPARGAFPISIVQRAAGGKVVSRSNPNPDIPSDRVLGQIVYAGMKPPSTSGSSGTSVTTIAGIALVGLGAVVGAAFAIRAWRGRRGGDDSDNDGEEDRPGAASPDRAREAELQARLSRFKTRAPDPPRS